MSAKTARRLTILAVLVGLMAMGPLAGEAAASHFRGGSISFQQSGAATNANFESTVSFRCDAFSEFTAPCNAHVGDSVNINESVLQYGDGASSDAAYTVVAVNVAENYFVARKNVAHNYPDTSSRTAFFTSCCTISTLRNNPDGTFKVETLVNLASDTNSPKTSVPPVVNVGNTGSQSFLVPATDPGGQTLRFRLATDSESGGTNVNPPAGYSIDPTTGRITIDTGVNTDGLYHSAIVIEALNGQTVVSSTLVTFLIRVGQQSGNPPSFIAPSPADGTEFTVAPGDTLSCGLRATDPDPGDSVDIVQGPLPAGASFNDTTGNPAEGTFAFTPTAGQDGQDFVVNFTAQDANGGSVFRSYTLKVRAGATTSVCAGLDKPATKPSPVATSSSRSCARRPISLIRADLRGGKVVLSGLVRASLAGRSIKILGNYGKPKSSAVTTLATAKANTSGRFTTIVPAPSRDQFSIARYRAQVGKTRSIPLKLAQSLASTKLTITNKQTELRGQVKPSVLGKRNAVVVRRLFCGHYKTVGKATPDKNGNYVVRFATPTNAKASLFRAESRVLAKPGSKRYVKRYARAVSITINDGTG